MAILIIILWVYILGVLLAYVFMGLSVVFYFNKYNRFEAPPDGFYWLSLVCILIVALVIIVDSIKFNIPKPDVFINRIINLFKKKKK